MEYQKLLIKLTKEPTYLRYGQLNIVFRSVPGEHLDFFGKTKGGAEHHLPLSMEILKTAIHDCSEISREEYEGY